MLSWPQGLPRSVADTPTDTLMFSLCQKIPIANNFVSTSPSLISSIFVLAWFELMKVLRVPLSLLIVFNIHFAWKKKGKRYACPELHPPCVLIAKAE